MQLQGKAGEAASPLLHRIVPEARRYIVPEARRYIVPEARRYIVPEARRYIVPKAPRVPRFFSPPPPHRAPRVVTRRQGEGD